MNIFWKTNVLLMSRVRNAKIRKNLLKLEFVMNAIYSSFSLTGGYTYLD